MNLQCILYAIIFLSNRIENILATNPDIVILQSGIGTVTPCGIGLEFFVELNNTSEKYDYEVLVSADQCCLEADGSLDCDVLQIIGDCVGLLPKNGIKTVRMIAPILDPIERRGYCVLFLDSKCSYNGRNMRDTIKINFNTEIDKINEIIEANIKPCKNVDEDPLNDCKPVDCDSYYNSQKPHYSSKHKRCVAAPTCITKIVSGIPNTIYDPVSNRCVKGKSISKRDIDAVQQINENNRQAKDVLIIDNFDEPLDDNFTSQEVNDALDQVPMCSKCNKLHILNSPTQSKREYFTSFLLKYLRNNENAVMIFVGVILTQCVLIIGMVYYLTKTCLCCREKSVVRKFFNYRQDASMSTPLIGTSNIYTETDYQFGSESSKMDKKIKCYNACDKERNNAKVVDDILSKCLNRRNWGSQNKTDPPEPMAVQVNIDNVNNEILTEIKVPETTVVFEDEKPKSNERISRKIESIPKCLNKEIIEREKEDLGGIDAYDSSEKEIQCHSYNSDNVTGFRPSVSKHLGYFKSENGPVPVATDKGTQAFFSNDTIDDFITERGIHIVENRSSFMNNSICTKYKSDTPTTVSSKTSKTSKNNIMKNIFSFIHKTRSNSSSDPGVKAKELDLKLIHLSKISICSSNDSACPKCIKTKTSRTSL